MGGLKQLAAACKAYGGTFGKYGDCRAPEGVIASLPPASKCWKLKSNVAFRACFEIERKSPL